jgi:hypothetical protein
MDSSSVYVSFSLSCSLCLSLWRSLSHVLRHGLFYACSRHSLVVGDGDVDVAVVSRWWLRAGVLHWLGCVQSGVGAGEGVDHGGVSGAGAAARRPRGFHISSVFRHRQAHAPRLGSR